MRLAELRNANPRDSGFKLWRQTTLTLIQRVWPGDQQRSERFRRIPFSPAATRPTRAQIREHFERGCAEATGYLRELIREIQHGALDPASADAPPPAALPSTPSSIAASLAAPLPGEAPGTHFGTEPLGPAAPAGPAPPPIPGFLSSSVSAAPREAVPPPGAIDSAPAPASRPPKQRKGDRRGLKEMLGFVDEPQGAPGEEAAEEALEPERPGLKPDPPALQGPVSPAAPAAGSAPPAPPPAVSGRPPHRAISYGIPAPPEPVEEDEGFLPDPRRGEPESDVEHMSEDDDPSIGEDPAELLRESAWLAAQKAAPPATPVAPTLRSPVAAALQALASEVAELGVPEGKRAATRAALTDLARRIEERTADWNTLRDAFGLAMDYPPLARRMVPLLVPYLDLE